MHEGIVQQFDEPQNLYLEPENLFVAKFMGNPIINIFSFDKNNNILSGENFSIDLSLFTKDRIKKDFNQDSYVVGIRPEYFVVCNSSIDKPLFKTKVESVELIGKDRIVNFTVNNVHAKTITDISCNIREGDEISLDIDYNGIYMFQQDGVRVY